MAASTSSRAGLRWRLGGALAAVVALLAASRFGETIVPRLSDHRGFQLVAVADRAGSPAVRPRRLFFVLIDGLRADVAAGMRAVRRLQAAGVCRKSAVSLPTVSRPVYAMVSTGLLQERTGARNNRDRTPLAAESVWQVARAQGRSVAGFSELPWWQELFPRGFDRYEVHPRADDYLARAARSTEDIVLAHPVYVDEAGHEHGAASAEYAAAAVRADGELGRLLDAVDLARDVVIVTADHGHSDRGGHGGPQPEVATVLTCYAGPGVVHREGTLDPASPPVLEQRHLGPLLAMLAGLPFPRHMQPGLPDELWADLGGLPVAYLDDRRAALARFAAASSGLPALRQAARQGQAARGGAVLLLALAGWLLAARWRRLDAGAQARLAAWMALVVSVHALVYTAVRGSFDMTSINQRAAWIRASLEVGLAVGLGGVLVRWGLGRVWPAWRDGRRRGGLLADQLTLMAAGMVALAAHTAAFGWALGYPLPGATLLFLHFFGALFVVSHALVALGCALAGATGDAHAPPPG